MDMGMDMEMEMGMDIGERERTHFFQIACKTAENTYALNPLDSDNLTRWGGALLELSPYQPTPHESQLMLKDAMAKLEEALEINPRQHDALWCLGNTLTTQAFMTPDVDQAKPLFLRSSDFFQRAVDEMPTNELYRKSLDLSSKALELHAEIHSKSQISGQQGFLGGPSSSDSTKKSKKKTSDFTYDVAGWVLLAAGILAWVGFAKNNMPPPPQTR